MEPVEAFSMMWLAMAVKEIKGKLITFEMKKDRVRDAENVLKDANLLDVVTIVIDDVCKATNTIQNEISLLFIDGKKEEYYKYLQAVKEKLAKGSLIIAHNTTSHPHLMSNYIKEVYKEGYISITTMSYTVGITISVKK